MTKYLLLLFTAFIVVSFSPQKSKILIIGDSISIGYTPFVKEALKEVAIVKHNPGNAQHSGTGLEKIDDWIGNEKWDVIQFNWGLWDLCYRDPESNVQGNRDKINGNITFSPEEYEKNLREIVKRLKQTNAKLIFVTTSYVPNGEAGRIRRDEIKYNRLAKRVMKENNILVNDIHSISKKIHKKHKKGDGDVHYTEEGYKLLAVSIVKFIEKEL
jgi:hypothetical protein